MSVPAHIISHPLKGLVHGINYGTKIRFPHALVMTFLFKPDMNIVDKLRRILKLTFLHSRNLAAFVCVYKLVIALGRFTYRVGGIKVCLDHAFMCRGKMKRLRPQKISPRRVKYVQQTTGKRETRSSGSTMACTSSWCNRRFYRVVKLQCCELSNCSVLAFKNHHSWIACTRQKRILTVFTFFVQTNVSLVCSWCVGHCHVAL